MALESRDTAAASLNGSCRKWKIRLHFRFFSFSAESFLELRARAGIQLTFFKQMDTGKYYQKNYLSSTDSSFLAS